MRLPLGYVIRRLVYLLGVVWFAASLNFVLPRLAARDPVLEHLTKLEASVGSRRAERIGEAIDRYKAWAGLNQPLWQQYVTYLRNMARLDFGYSFSRYRPVWKVISYALPWTVGPLGVTTLISFALGTVFGAMAAWRRSNTLLNVGLVSDGVGGYPSIYHRAGPG